MENIQSYLWSMPDAHIYFACMIVIMLPLVTVHLACWQIVKRFPETMPDEKAREGYNFAEVVMAAVCLAGLWYMWMFLPWMVSICATDPTTGLVAHGPWIVLFGVLLFAKVNHLWRLLAQVQAT